MPTPIILPELGVTGQPIRVSTWLVEIGENVHEGDRVVEILVPGMTFDVSAPVTGRLTHIDRFADEPLKGEETLGWIEANQEE